MVWLKILDVLLIALHCGLILFNLFGWAWPRTRKLNLATLTATAFSWFVLGVWYGFGYCPLTDWHWRVRLRLGDTDLPNSYLKFLFDRVTGLSINATLVDTITVVAFLGSFALSVGLNFRDWRRSKSARKEDGRRMA